MIKKLPCKLCGVQILPRTAERNNGLCMPCFIKEFPEENKTKIFPTVLTSITKENLSEQMSRLILGDAVCELLEDVLKYPNWTIQAYKNVEKDLSDENIEAIKYIQENKVDIFKLILEDINSGKISTIPLAILAIGITLSDTENVTEILDLYPDDIKQSQLKYIYETDPNVIDNEHFKALVEAYKVKRPTRT